MTFFVTESTINSSSISNTLLTADNKLIVAYVKLTLPLTVDTEVYELWISVSEDQGETWNEFDTTLRADSPIANLISLPVRLVQTPAKILIVWDRYVSSNRTLSVITLDEDLVVENILNRTLGSYITAPFSDWDTIRQNSFDVRVDERGKIHIFQNTPTSRYLRTNGSVWELENRFSVFPVNSSLTTSVFTSDFKYHIFSCINASSISHGTINTTQATVASVNTGSFLTGLFTNQGNIVHNLNSLTARHIRAFNYQDQLFLILLGVQGGERKIAILKKTDSWNVVAVRDLNFSDRAISCGLIDDQLIVDAFQWDLNTESVTQATKQTIVVDQLQYNRQTNQVFGCLVEANSTQEQLNFWTNDRRLFVDPQQPVSNWTPLQLVTDLSQLNGVVGDDIELTLQASGGLGPYRYRCEDLPQGLQLQQDTIVGTLTTKETTDLQVFVYDCHNTSLQVEEQIDVECSELVLQNDNEYLTSPIIGTPYSYQLASNNNGEAVVYSIDSGSLPSGLSLSASGMISGTANGSPGVSTLDIQGANDGGTSVISISLNVLNSTTLEIDTDTLPDAVYDIAYSENIIASGGTAPYTFRVQDVNQLPDGLVLQSDGELTGSPDSTGEYVFTILVRDDNDEVVSKQFSLTVSKENVLIDTSVLPDGVEEVDYEQTIQVDDSQTSQARLFLQQGVLPAGLRLRGRKLLGDPVIPTSTDIQFSLTATDESTSDSVEYDFSVNSSEDLKVGDIPEFWYQNKFFYNSLSVTNGLGSLVRTERPVVQQFIVSELLLSRGYVDLQYVLSGDIVVLLGGGTVQLRDVDYMVTIDDNRQLKRLNWKFLGENSGIGQLAQGDVLTVEYTTLEKTQINLSSTSTAVSVELIQTEVIQVDDSGQAQLSDSPLPETDLVTHVSSGSLIRGVEYRIEDDLLIWNPADEELETGADFILENDYLIVSYGIQHIHQIGLDQIPVDTNNYHLFTWLYTVTQDDLNNEHIDLPVVCEVVRPYVVNGALAQTGYDYQIVTDGSELRRVSWSSLAGGFNHLLPGDQILFVLYANSYALQATESVWSENPPGLGLYDKIPIGVTLDSNGLLSGVPTTTGEYNWRLSVVDEMNQTTERFFRTVVLPKSLALENSHPNTGDGINHTDLTSILGTYDRQIDNIQLLWVGGSVKISFDLFSDSASFDNTINFPGLVQFSTTDSESSVGQEDWIDAPISLSSTVVSLGSSLAGNSCVCYIPILGVLNSLNKVVDFRVRIAIGDSTSFVDQILTRASAYSYSDAIQVSDRLSMYTRARKNRAISDGLLNG